MALFCYPRRDHSNWWVGGGEQNGSILLWTVDEHPNLNKMLPPPPFQSKGAFCPEIAGKLEVLLITECCQPRWLALLISIAFLSAITTSLPLPSPNQGHLKKKLIVLEVGFFYKLSSNKMHGPDAGCILDILLKERKEKKSGLWILLTAYSVNVWLQLQNTAQYSLLELYVICFNWY